MTLKLGNFTYHITCVPRKYNLSIHITSDPTERCKQLNYYPHLKDSLKKQIRERDNYTCQICGQEGYPVDHIIPWRISHDNSPNNLRTLCRKCNLERRQQRRDARLPLKEYYKYIEAELEKYREKQSTLDFVL